MKCTVAIRRETIYAAPLLVLFLLAGAAQCWSAGPLRPLRFVFDARYTALPGEEASSSREAARERAFAGVTKKAIRALENKRIMKEYALAGDGLEQLLAAYFPPTIDRLKEHDLGDKKVFVARGVMVVDPDEFQEALRLWAAYKRKGKALPPRIKKAPPAPANATMAEQAANATETVVPLDPLDQPLEVVDLGTVISLPELDSGAAGESPYAPAAQQPVEYANARDMLVQIVDLWDGSTFKDPERALELARLALVRQPKSHIAANNMGVAFHALGKYEQAMDAYTQAIALQKDFVDAYHNRAQAHYLRGEYDLAINDYSKVLRINSEYINARTHRALAYGKTGNAESMCNDLEVACRIGHCSFYEAAQRLGDCP